VDVGKVLRAGALAACLQGLAACAGVSAAGGGVAPVSAHPAPLEALADSDPVLAANKRLVFDMWRSIVNAGHVELAETMLTEGYMQHSPVLPTGRAAFRQIFSVMPRIAIPDVVSPPLVAILAEGDLAVMAMREQLPHPVGGGSYTTTHFNLFRIEQGRLAEHWHSVQGVPGPDLPPFGQGGPHPITGAIGAAQLALLEAANPQVAANKRLVFDAWREVFEAGRESSFGRYFAPNFVTHDPTAQSPRDLFTAATGAPAAAISAPLVAVVAQGDLVVLVRAKSHPHPHRPGTEYTTALFDMFRIADNRIIEHWNGATVAGGSLGAYVD